MWPGLSKAQSEDVDTQSIRGGASAADLGVTLNASANIVQRSTPLLKKLQPRLYEAPAEGTFRKATMAYGDRDPVPRVERRVEMLLTAAQHLTNGE